MFREIGLADELGSGMRNTYKYTKMYSGGEPQFVEGDILRITIPLPEVETATMGPNDSNIIDEIRNETGNEIRNETEKLSQMEERILDEIQKNPHATKRQISEVLDISQISVARATKKLKDIGIIERIGSTKSGYWKVTQ